MSNRRSQELKQIDRKVRAHEQAHLCGWRLIWYAVARRTVIRSVRTNSATRLPAKSRLTFRRPPHRRKLSPRPSIFGQLRWRPPIRQPRTKALRRRPSAWRAKRAWKSPRCARREIPASILALKATARLADIWISLPEAFCSVRCPRESFSFARFCGDAGNRVCCIPRRGRARVPGSRSRVPWRFFSADARFPHREIPQPGRS